MDEELAQLESATPRPAVPAGVIAVVRAPTAAEARTIVRGLVLAAVPAIELTMTVPDAVQVIADFASARPVSGAGTMLGPGTVLGAGALIDRAAARRGDADAVAAHARRVLDEITEADGHAEDH